MAPTISTKRWNEVLGRASALSADVQQATITGMSRVFDHNRISAMGWLRDHRPNVSLRHPSLAIVTTRDDVLAVLGDAARFRAPYAKALPGPFVLGLEGAEYQRQRRALAAALDTTGLVGGVKRTADEYVRAAVRTGVMDVGADLVHPVMDEVVGSYLGAPGPDSATQWLWAQDLFENIFLNFTNLPALKGRAAVSSAQMTAHIAGLIAARRALLADDAFTSTPPDDVLGRLLAQQRTQPDESLTDEEIALTLLGTAIGWLWHGARAALIAVDGLLDRPEALAQAREAAVADDMTALRRVLWEILRFRPVQAFLPREAVHDTVIAEGTAREQPIKAGTLVLAGTHSAMWDATAVPCPHRFDTTRSEDQYVIFGRDEHRCLGEQIMSIQLPEMLAPLLAVEGLHRLPGKAGRLRWDGARAVGLNVGLRAVATS